MQREIKFRVWHKEGKEMIYPDNPAQPFLWKDEGQPVEILQYTGAKAMNGAPIYEGDIDKDGGMVIWNQDDCSFVVDYADIEVHPLSETELWFEIAGNVYETPELLIP